MSCLLIKCCKYFVLCLLYITDTIPWQAVCTSTTLKYNRSLEKHVLAHFQRTTCSQIYFRFNSYLLRKPLLIRSTAFICNIDSDWMIYRKHPIRSLLTSMLRKANIRYSSDVYALPFEKYKGEFLKDKNVLLMYTTVLSLTAYTYVPNLESLLTQQYVFVIVHSDLIIHAFLLVFIA